MANVASVLTNAALSDVLRLTGVHALVVCMVNTYAEAFEARVCLLLAQETAE